MTGTSIAAVIPAYNAEEHIAAAIASLQAQTAPPQEIVVVDDGSRDGTADVAERSGARVLRRANGGPAAARNAGIAATSSAWVALLDADDICYSNRLEREQAETGDERVGVVFSRHRVPGKNPPPPPDQVDFEVLWRRNCVPTSTVLLRRVAWEQAGGFDEDRALIGVEDYNLWLRLAHAGWQFRPIQEELVEYRPTPASLTNQLARFARAELANLKHLAVALPLEPDRIRAKEFAVYREYAFEFFHSRELPLAREFFREASRRGALDWPARLRDWASRLPLPARTGA